MPPPVPPVNPVLYLLAMDGSGTTFVDDGPDHLTVSRVGGVSDIITQNSDVTLFGLPTGLFNRPVGNVPLAGLEWTNPSKVLAVGDDYCIEWWEYFVSGTISASSLLQHALLWTGSNLSNFVMYSGVAGNFVFFTNSSGVPSSLAIVASALNWHYCAMQYVAADDKTYCSMDGALVATLNSLDNPGTVTGFRGRAFCNNPGSSTSRIFSSRLAQVRGTKANLYGSSAAPVPTGPWPKF